MQSTNNFNLIDFLNLSHLSQKTIEDLLPQLYKDISFYLINRFLEDLPSEKYQEVSSKVQLLQNPSQVDDLIYSYMPDFQTKKIRWLKDYQMGFSLNKFLKDN